MTHKAWIKITLALIIIPYSANAYTPNYFEEAALLEKYSKYVKKVEGGYKINCVNGTSSILKNIVTTEAAKKDSIATITEGEASTKSYVFEDYFNEIGYLGFSVFYYELGGYEMVNINNCNITNVFVKPHLSPNHKVIIADTYNEMDGGGIYVFDASNNIKQKKYFSDLEVHFHSWIDSSNARLQSFYVEQSDAKNFILHYDKVIDDWVLQPTSEIFQKVSLTKKSKVDPKKITKLTSDKQTVLKILKDNPDNLEFLSPDLRNDREVIMSVISMPENGYYFKYASAKLRDDEELARLSLRINTSTFESLSERLRSKKDFVRDVVEKSGYELNFASAILKDDPEIVKIAAIQYPPILMQISPRFREDDKFMISIIESNANAITAASAKLKDDKNFAIKSLLTTHSVAILEYLSERLRDDEDVVEMAVRKNQSNLLYTSERIRGDKKIALKLITLCSYPKICIHYLSKELQQDADILRLAKSTSK
jgi:hypothetical protein